MNLKEVYTSTNNISDKDTTHSYLEVYDELFLPYRKKNINLLEIGNAGGESIRLWNDYFNSINITGIELLDIWEKHQNPVLRDMNKNYDNINIHVNTDAYVESTYMKFSDKRFDIIIDDGSHLPQHQIFVLKFWFNLLKPNGIMVIEDVQNINYITLFKEQGFDIEVFDRRKIKNRYDDIIIVARNNI